MTSFFTRNYIPYIPSYAGLYVFARVAPYAKSWEKEAMVVQRLKDAGVLVSAGRAYHTLENDKGWARVSFALPKEKLEEAVMRMQKVFLTEPAQG